MREAKRAALFVPTSLSFEPERNGRSLLLVRVPSYGWQAIVFYTYLLQSLTDPKQRYVGHTADLRTRVAEHNAGKSLIHRSSCPGS